jgi:hypothetical protein
MPNIAISYRRSDSSALAGRIFDRLAAHYGKHAVFMDVDAIPIGVDFRAHIDETLRHTDVLLAVIGAKWLGPRKGSEARLSEATDPVRVEIETALARKTPIIPVLIDGAKMPDAGQLPPEFGNFAYLNAAEVTTGRDFHSQMERLIAAIDRASAAKPDAAAAVYSRDAAHARRALGRDAARYGAAPLALLLVAHYLVVLGFDLNLAYLWLACVAVPLAFGAGLASTTSRGWAAAVGFALALGAIADCGMSVSESLATGDPLTPQTRSEWLENFQFFAVVGLSFLAGYFVAKAAPQSWRRRLAR